jgi:competence protein ComEC
MALASDVFAPAPGTPLRALVRVGATGTPTVVAMTARGPPRGAWMDRWSRSASRRVRELLTDEPGGLVSALVLGQRGELAFPILADCRATGTMHLLALSGLHVALVAVALQRMAGIRRPLGVALVLLLFIALAGSRPPLQRAGLGWGLAAIGLRTGCAAASLHRLAVVALAMEAWQPGLHRELGAQLSFLAVAGLLATSRLARGPAALFVAPSGAFLATAPLIAETFGVVQPFGIVVTPLLVPLVGALMGLGLLAIVPGDLLAGLDLLTGPALTFCARSLRAVLATLADWAPAPFYPPAPTWPGWSISLAVVAALWMLPGRERRGGLVEVSAT